VCELEKHGMIDLKSLLQETPWCNRILVLILGLGDLIFFTSKSMGYVLISEFRLLMHGRCMFRCLAPEYN
jgi:hypothetical protein